MILACHPSTSPLVPSTAEGSGRTASMFQIPKLFHAHSLREPIISQWLKIAVIGKHSITSCSSCLRGVYVACLTSVVN